jgi:hypothetical protein
MQIEKRKALLRATMYGDIPVFIYQNAIGSYTIEYAVGGVMHSFFCEPKESLQHALDRLENHLQKKKGNAT